ncbi:Hypothetical protein GbCGDNIH4_7189 [Granulibacter bethesdensis CGDNIH4]|nr:Hypothetical protein GbCGDNIH4_7189 [Granulibacter bethesdensis CGDNIH4]
MGAQPSDQGIRGLTPDRLRQILDLIHWSGRGLAAILKCDERLVRRWAAGSIEIPETVASWLEILADTHSANPPPQSWRQRAERAQVPISEPRIQTPWQDHESQ